MLKFDVKLKHFHQENNKKEKKVFVICGGVQNNKRSYKKDSIYHRIPQRRRPDLIKRFYCESAWSLFFAQQIAWNLCLTGDGVDDEWIHLIAAALIKRKEGESCRVQLFSIQTFSTQQRAFPKETGKWEKRSEFGTVAKSSVQFTILNRKWLIDWSIGNDHGWV